MMKQKQCGGPMPDRLRASARPLLIVLLALGLAGCGSAGGESFCGLFGGRNDEQQLAQVSPAGPSTFGGVSIDQLRADQLCPSILVREGTDILRLYDTEMDRGPSSVRYQSQIVQTAVECTPGNGQFGLTIGIAGRALIGPRGGPASLDLPIRIVVINRTDNQVISSQIVRTNAVIEPGEVSAVFTLVDRSFFVPTPARQADYQILVGFDEQAR